MEVETTGEVQVEERPFFDLWPGDVKVWMYGERDVKALVKPGGWPAYDIGYDRCPLYDTPDGQFWDFVPDDDAVQTLQFCWDTGCPCWCTEDRRFLLDRPDDDTPVRLVSQDMLFLLLLAYKRRQESDWIAEEFKALYGRWRENLVRAAGKVEEYGLCNSWDFFGTITIDKTKLDRQDLDGLYQYVVRGYLRNRVTLFSRWSKRDGRSLVDAKVRYLIVPELHGDGKSYHLHGLFSFGDYWLDDFKDFHDDLDKKKLPHYVRRKADKPGQLFYSQGLADDVGYNIFEYVRDKRAAARYLLKYIRKGFKDISGKMDKGKNLYWHSKGLEKKVSVKYGALDRDGYRVTLDRHLGDSDMRLVWLSNK